MNDWRNKPRTGKSEFFPLIPEITKRLGLGETYKQIHDDLTANERIKIGYHQFAKYIKKTIHAPAVSKNPGTNIGTGAGQPTENAFAKVASRTEKRRETDDTFHQSVPDKAKIYGPS